MSSKMEKTLRAISHHKLLSDLLKDVTKIQGSISISFSPGHLNGFQYLQAAKEKITLTMMVPPMIFSQ